MLRKYDSGVKLNPRERTNSSRRTSQQSALIFVRKYCSYALSSADTNMFSLNMILFMEWAFYTLFMANGDTEREATMLCRFWKKGKRNHMIIFTLGGDCWRWDNWLQMHYVLCCHDKGKGGHHGNKLCLKSLCNEARLPLSAPIRQSQKAWRMERRHGNKRNCCSVRKLPGQLQVVYYWAGSTMIMVDGSGNSS